MDPLTLNKNAGQPSPAPTLASPEQEEFVAEFKARRYAAWLDQPLPALNHRTPRECVRTAAGRAEVDLLLKDMEHMEQRARGVLFDFSTIRWELGITMR